MKNVGVLVSGGGTNLQAMIDQACNIVTVVSSRLDAYALERARRAGIDARVLLDEAEIVAHMRAFDVELIVLAGYLKILRGELLRDYAGRIINVHPSLIPSFCGDGFYGLRIHEAVLDYGVKVTGATVHYVNDIVDGGEIILQKAVEVRDGDTPEMLQERVMKEAEWEILPQAVKQLTMNKH